MNNTLSGFLRSAVCLLLCGLIVACGGGGGGSAPPPAPPSASPPAPPSPPPPPPATTLGTPSLMITADTVPSSVLSIGPAGGELSARATDGSRYRLVVPPGALAGPTTITMQPVAAVGGLPLDGGTIAAVDLQPTGLAFARPAMLFVSPADSPDAMIAGFGWSGDGNSFGVQLARGSGAGPWVFEVHHFSGYGLAVPGPSQLAGFANDLAALATESQGFVDGWRALFIGIIEGTATLDDLTAHLQDWLDNGVEPRLAAAPDSPAAAILAFRAYTEWVSFLYLSHDPEDSPTLEAERLAAVTAAQSAIFNHLDAYTRPQCSATVPAAQWTDWLRVPEELSLTHLNGALPYLPPLLLDQYCVTLQLREVSFPDSVDDTTTTLDLSFRTVVALPDGTDVPLPAKATFTYGDGLSGDTPIEADAADPLQTTIDRDPTGAARAVVELQVEETLIKRPDVLSKTERLIAGGTELYFQENFDPAPRAYLSSGQTVPVCAFVSVGPPAGQTVSFRLDGPGTLSATSAVTSDALGVGQACVDYTAPAGLVARGITGNVRASVAVGGETFEDVLQLYVEWAEVLLRADIGLGPVDVSNRAVSVDSAGPFPVEARVLASPPTTADQPLPVTTANYPLTVTATEAIVGAGGGLADGASIVTGDDGIARFTVNLANAVSSSQRIDVTTALEGDDIAAGTSASFFRDIARPSIDVEFDGRLQGNAPKPLTVRVSGSDSTAYANVYLDFDANGGTVSPSSGSSGVGGEFTAQARLANDSDQISIGVTARSAPGGEFFGGSSVTGVRVPEGLLYGTYRLEAAYGLVERFRNWCPAGGSPACLHPDYGNVSGSGRSNTGTSSVRQNLVGEEFTRTDSGMTFTLTALTEAEGDVTSSGAGAEMGFEFGLANIHPWPVPIRIDMRCSGENANGRLELVSGQTPKLIARIDGASYMDAPTSDTVEMTLTRPSDRYRLRFGTNNGSCSYEMKINEDVP